MGLFKVVQVIGKFIAAAENWVINKDCMATSAEISYKIQVSMLADQIIRSFAVVVINCPAFNKLHGQIDLLQQNFASTRQVITN